MYYPDIFIEYSYAFSTSASSEAKVFPIGELKNNSFGYLLVFQKAQNYF